ncbi:methyl-accepting chemotaxis protein [Peribacillus asahii]|uniref:methyl-accepting chemotaxis protein n=1 Tax=Peribacillus asahii TaxID=228899 RepID=UPI00207A1D1B|nr:methyl-accepting chemotaxis protein [Peribacillus asahii]USK61454.1 methyl-accepting chemotaxis protein [Peribacillus asahii]
MRKKSTSIRTKLIMLCVIILIVPTTILGISTYSSSKNQLNEAGQDRLKRSTEMVLGMISLLNQEVQAKNMTLEEAQEKLRVELYGEKGADNTRTLKEAYTFGAEGYIYAADDEATLVMHPFTEGQNIYDSKSEDGVMVGQETVAIGKEGGFLYYKWLNKSTNKNEEKVAYVERDPYWGWTIASTAYLSEFNSSASEIANIVLIVAVLAIVLGSIVAYYFSVRFTKPIIQISGELNRAAEGDFSGEDIKVTTKDEIGALTEDFNKMRANTKVLLAHVNNSTEHVAASSEQLSASAEETSKATEEITHAIQLIATGAEDSTNSLQESSQSLDEVTIGIQNLAENSATISEAGTMIAEKAQQGNVYVEQTVKQINSINNKVNESGQVLQLLDSSSNEIGEISKVITDIADQTNLLALNAAIEAARAGEHGKGFAVVAEEVRKLAEQSQNSSHQISDLIKDIQLNMARSTESMNQVKVEVQDGLEIVGKTELSFQEIVTAMEQMKKQLTDMAATVQQMSAGAQEVSATVTNNTHTMKEASYQSQQVAATTEEQLAAMQEVTHSANSLSKLAVELQEIVNKFKI